VATIVALVVSLLALALAAVACFRPTHDGASATPPQYSDQQVADAKKNVCDAYDTAYKAIQGASSYTSEDPNQKFMIALHVRLAFTSAADYILATLSQNPVGPQDVLDSARKVAMSYQKLVLMRSAQAPDSEIDLLGNEIHEAEASLTQVCK